MGAKAVIIAFLFSASALAICMQPVLWAQDSNQAVISDQDAANDLSVVVGGSVLVDCAKPVRRVAVGLGDFAEATAISPTEILLLAV